MAHLQQKGLLFISAAILFVALAFEAAWCPSSLLAQPPSGRGESFFTVQAGSYDFRSLAVKELSLIRKRLKSHDPDYIRVIEVSELFAVRVGRYADRATATYYQKLLRQLYPDAFILTVRNERVIHLLDPATMTGLDGDQTFTEVVVKITDSQFIPTHLDIESDKLYKLKLINIGATRNRFDVPQLSEKVMTLKIVVVDSRGEMIVEIEGKPTRLELAPGQAVEWWFVPLSFSEVVI